MYTGWIPLKWSVNINWHHIFVLQTIDLYLHKDYFIIHLELMTLLNYRHCYNNFTLLPIITFWNRLLPENDIFYYGVRSAKLCFVANPRRIEHPQTPSKTTLIDKDYMHGQRLHIYLLQHPRWTRHLFACMWWRSLLYSSDHQVKASPKLQGWLVSVEMTSCDARVPSFVCSRRQSGQWRHHQRY